MIYTKRGGDKHNGESKKGEEIHGKVCELGLGPLLSKRVAKAEVQDSKRRVK
jgi:hypothetical protein